MPVAGIVRATSIMFPRKNPRTPSFVAIWTMRARSPCRAAPRWTAVCRSTLTRARGAPTVRENAPASPPATKTFSLRSGSTKSSRTTGSSMIGAKRQNLPRIASSFDARLNPSENAAHAIVSEPYSASIDSTAPSNTSSDDGSSSLA
eukprot:Amastigsp_a678719_14.p2 type:complete len:147 gc:universal Amastigsp_a678719_14:661-1101(+)